jgi:TatA/E family protein of Tat protein translocase
MEIPMIGGLQPTHILIIVAVAILFFTPSRLPNLVRGISKAISEFKTGLDSEDPKSELPVDPKVNE